jgi:hypothetical protein
MTEPVQDGRPIATPVDETPDPELRMVRRQWRNARWTLAVGDGPTNPRGEVFARTLAEHIIAHRLRGTPQFQEAWARVAAGGDPYTTTERSAMSAFLDAIRTGISAEVVEAFVAEYLWHYLVSTDPEEPALVRVLGPKFHVTAPGGDGLVVRRGATLRSTLWEIKKHRGADLSGVINEAYTQLGASATQYLAEYSAVEQVDPDPELARLFARLVEAWITGEATARVGVSVAGSTAPRKSYTTMGNYFTQLVSEDSRHGVTIAIDSFPAFALRVRELLWTGL